MGHENHAFSNVFILLGLFSSSQTSLIFFSFTLIIFIMTITENAFFSLSTGIYDSTLWFPAQHLFFLWISCVFPTLFPKWSLTFCQAIVLFHFRVVASKYFCPSPSWVLCLSSVSDVLWLLGSHLSSTVLSHSYEWLSASSWLQCPDLLGQSTPLFTQLMHFTFPSVSQKPLFCEVPAILVLSCVVTTHYEWGVYHHFPAHHFLPNLCLLCPNSHCCTPSEVMTRMEK